MVNILLPFDGSAAALRAVELVAGYAGEKPLLAPRLLNVQPRPLKLWPGASLDPAALEAALLEAGRRSLEPAAARLSAAGFQPRQDVRTGVPAEVIRQEAEAQRAELIVMGTRGEGALQGFSVGSVALRVAHRAGTPVLLVKPQDRLPAALGRRLRVLLAMDGSEPAARAAERLVAWQTWLGELDVQLVYVQQPLTMIETVLAPHEDVLAQWSTEEGEEATAAARALFARQNVAHHVHLTAGDPAREIHLLAQQTQCELVVLGTRGLGAAHHALIGSVALKSAVLCEMPVLLVP